MRAQAATVVQSRHTTRHKEHTPWSRKCRRSPQEGRLHPPACPTPARQHRQGFRPADLAGRPGRVRQGAGRRRQGVRGAGQGRRPMQRKTQAVAEEKIGDVTGKMSRWPRTVPARPAPVGQAREHLRGAHRQGAGQAGRAPAKDIDVLVGRIDELAARRQLGKAPQAAPPGRMPRPRRPHRRQARPQERRRLTDRQTSRRRKGAPRAPLSVFGNGPGGRPQPSGSRPWPFRIPPLPWPCRRLWRRPPGRRSVPWPLRRSLRPWPCRPSSCRRAWPSSCNPARPPQPFPCP